MRKVVSIAFAISSVFAVSASFALAPTISSDELPVLTQESQHATATKRISNTFNRSHYKEIKLDDELSSLVFDRFIKQMDYNKSVFLQSDVEGFEQFRGKFDEMLKKGKLNPAYSMFNISLNRRYERFEYALSLLDEEMTFDTDEEYHFDREDAAWPKTKTELDELWRQRVKYDALRLKLTGKDWAGITEVLTKRYNTAIKRLTQSQSEDVFQILMNAYARSIEAHTSYLSPRNAERFQMEMNLSLEGIGAVLSPEDDYTVVRSLVAGGPADKASKIKPKDKIVAVAQGDDEFVDIVGWRLDDVVELIKGPKGSTVRLQIIKGGTTGSDTQEVVIVRDKIKLEDKAATSEVYEDPNNTEKKLGVIIIPSFYNNLSEDVKKEIAKLQESDVEGLIIDLRGNGGGSLPEAIKLSGLFFDKGPVVQVRQSTGRISTEQDLDGVTYYDGPLTVLVDRYSASASEIFAAAIQDYGRGVIMGENTYGKGTVQQHKPLGRIYDLYEKPIGNIQYTIAKFYRIDGGSTQNKGVVPDIIFPSAFDADEWGESKEEQALPWDQIRRASYSTLGELGDDLAVLKDRHVKWTATSEEFEYLNTDIAEFRESKDKKTVSLNEKVRLAKKDEATAKELARANERLARMNLPAIENIDDLPEDFEVPDVLLDAAANISFEYINLGRLAKADKPK